MAAPTKGATSLSALDKVDENKQAQASEELDFCSPNFDPLKALFSPDVIVPYENVTSFSDLKSYEKAVQSRKEKHIVSSKVVKASVSSDSKIGISERLKHIAETQVGETSKHLQKLGHHLKVSDSETSGLIKKPDGGSQNVSRGRGLKNLPSSHVKSLTGKESPSTSSPAPEHKKDHRSNVLTRTRMPPSSHMKSFTGKESSLTSSPAPEHKKDHHRNVLTRMTQVEGPLVLLKRCVEERLHVRVMTRAAVHVRSICRGYIVAFDKTFNVAMIDVDEIYRRPFCLGKVKARRTQKMTMAQKTLQSEREKQNKKFLSTQKSLSILSLTETKSSSPATQKPEDSSKLEAKQFAKLKDEGMTSSSNTSAAAATTALVKKKSVYEGLPCPYSFYEREALMLGIPDENVEHRHVNQILIRGENIVLISIIDD